MTKQDKQNQKNHREKVKKMQEMVNNTLQNVYDTEVAIEHEDCAAKVQKCRTKNIQRLESVEDARREIEEERSYL
ncbi:hypothetical protein [Jeotgalibacillus proteolyticus]|uniref:Small, acid-soluble spore protein Tlp n=1 Tax=Jeotgalibacillus proteolyticus TaxID=2082395 RepID=A0A2S5GDE9_9BACL|nr:hypothetical protein [Jeotgalibacillus proteolyticus]PPA70934.1 hypothetical protein C4B60_09125 [Jeotgalibacillus proteolyticus]